jgi:hypothetical protein
VFVIAKSDKKEAISHMVGELMQRRKKENSTMSDYKKKYSVNVHAIIVITED